MIDYMKPVFRRSDDTYVITYRGYPYHVLTSDPLYKVVESYLAEHPEALAPEPKPPEPTEEEKAAAQRTVVLAELAALDAKSIRPLRALASGVDTEEDRTMLVELEDKASIFRTELFKMNE
jgi:hypothetical protein